MAENKNNMRSNIKNNLSTNYIMDDKNNDVKKINNNIHSNIKNNLSTNYIMTSRKSILERNNKNERSKPVVYKRENNLTKEEVKEKLINESKKIKQSKKNNIKKILNELNEKKN